MKFIFWQGVGERRKMEQKQSKAAYSTKLYGNKANNSIGSVFSTSISLEISGLISTYTAGSPVKLWKENQKKNLECSGQNARMNHSLQSMASREPSEIRCFESQSQGNIKVLSHPFLLNKYTKSANLASLKLYKKPTTSHIVPHQVFYKTFMLYSD